MWALTLKRSHSHLKPLWDRINTGEGLTGVLLQRYKNKVFDQSNTDGLQENTWRDSHLNVKI